MTEKSGVSQLGDPADLLYWPVINSAKLDGSFTPKNTAKHGAAMLWQTTGWTVLALHDYSRDSRPASNAAFILRGTHSAEEVLAAVRESLFASQLDRIEARGPITVVGGRLGVDV